MQKLQLFIPEPCHENWQTMTATEQGRFCNSCAKEVIDFSIMTDTEVLNYFTALTHEKVCGRALPTQLNRNITLPKEPRKRLFWYWNYIVMFFMFFSKANTSKAQGNVKTAIEINKLKSPYINAALTNSIIGDTVINSVVISGQVVDKSGNPVSFAIIKSVNDGTGIAADANGGFSIKINPQNPYIKISAVSFVAATFNVSSISNNKFILEADTDYRLSGEVLIVGSISGSSGKIYTPIAIPKRVAVLEVKDEISGASIAKANVKVIVNRSSYSAFTDKKGIYKIKRIKENDSYLIKVQADGFESNDFIITGGDFSDRKKVFEIPLRKLKTKSPGFKTANKVDEKSETIILGGVRSVSDSKGLLYLIDGKIQSSKELENLNPDDIEDVTLLEPAKAKALYGPKASTGAMIINTRKMKSKNLDTVIVVSPPVCIKSRVTGTMSAKGISESYNDKKTDVIKSADNKLRVYPNPVLRGNIINMTLMLKQTGLLNIRITDVSGRIVLQKQVNGLSKEQNEQIKCEHKWSTGIYYISVFDNQNKLISKTNFIVQ